MPLLANKKTIRCKWVYKINLHLDGTIERYTARHIAKGYNQVCGIDYVVNFSSVEKVVTLRILRFMLYLLQ